MTQHFSFFFGSRSLTGAFDEPTQVADGKVDGEVHGSQQLDEEEVPTQQTGDERDTTRGVLQVDLGSAIADCEEEGGEGAKRRDERRKDQHEDDVCPERADQVDKAQDAHVDVEIGKGGREDRVRAGLSRVRGIVGDRGIEVGCQGSTKGEPESAERTEHDKRERVSQDELEEASECHEKTAEKVVDTAA